MVDCGVHLDQRLCVSLFTRKASFLHSTGSSCGDDVFQPVFPRNLFTVITYSRDQGSLHCCLRHCPPLLPFRPSAQLPRKFSTGFIHSTRLPFLVGSSIVSPIISFTFPRTLVSPRFRSALRGVRTSVKLQMEMLQMDTNIWCIHDRNKFWLSQNYYGRL